MSVAYDNLLADLYRSTIEPDFLQAFLHGLCVAANSHIGTLQVQSLDNKGGSVSCVVGVDLSEVDHYAEYAAQNIWFERMGHLVRPGSVYFGDDWVKLKELKCSAFYHGVLRQVDVEHTLGIYVSNRAGATTFISPCRSERSGPYDAAERDMAIRLAPHVVNAFALREQHLAACSQRDLALRSQRAVFWLDQEFRWIGGNDAAEQALAENWWMRRSDKLLEPMHPSTRAAWRDAQRTVARGDALASQVFPVYIPDGSLVAFGRLHSLGAALADERGMPSHALFLAPFGGQRNSALAPQLQWLYRLTPAEAALVDALRVAGDLEGAAHRLGIGHASARTRLQAVFDKTGLHSRLELVRMADALAEICE